MNKMKGVVAAIEYSPCAMYVDQRMRFKHQSLLQDFEDLHMETDAMRKKLQKMKERRLTLSAEVRFLRRHKFLMQNRSSSIEASWNFVQPPNTVVRSKSNVKEKNSTGRGSSLRRLAMSFGLSQKRKTYSEKEASFIHHSHMFDLNQKQHKNINGKGDALLQRSSPILDLNQRERLYGGREATAQTMKPIFDLKQISREEELQSMDNSKRIEEFKKSTIRIPCDWQHNDIKISTCRNTGNGPNRVGKRKISWQDQVALRV
ncbi:hypothetical protein F3Y22_tig00112293pilonHSYRG00145 [Hibiscus syriacus]|uniref:Uncharacterized protein n=1 Tax=Hibiscus syriacus TaxID=106335 RepID=A0A6A2Y9R1_HIBSY|nr:uncharacterized protein LOC120177665 [Hibiscus syriacus]KAE8668547.1 hypothetical protein F3Y22_tig00112293pilonHSYRG00145 [Hibiscus syriacus]